MPQQNPPDQLLAAIMRGDRGAANAVLEQFAPQRTPEQVISELLEPTLRAIGEAWAKESISLAQGYIAGKVVEDFLERVAEQRAQAPAGKRPGPVVIANAEDDFHPLGRRMVGTFLKLDGWEVIDLGTDVTADRLLDAAEQSGAKVVGVSAMMLTTARNIRAVRAQIERRGLRAHLKLAVGGAVFNLRPELVNELGGDGTAPNALEAPALFARLWESAS
jgi:methanogenic corrinoid protein MtbC1